MHYWSGNQLWEKTDKQAVMQKIVFTSLASPCINQVCNLLKSEERYCQWQKNCLYIPVGSEGRINIVDKEIGILKISQKSEIHSDSKNKNPAFFPTPLTGDKASYCKIKTDRKQNQDEINRLPPGIKKQGSQHQKGIRDVQSIITRANEIAGYAYREEKENKLIRIK